ncbi:hypothetical protein EU537_12880 [Candidatus Thorarchaeota archaeon]|nr:MAG: hypothetical protein EU537_12880 [Candidatus Thorarchaeota archaeon]
MMRTQLEFYMDEIAGKLERLFELALHAFMQSMQAFEDLDAELASKVRDISDDVEELANKVEDSVFETIARRQPVASDLRRLSTYHIVSYNLYRVGRYAYKIAHIVDLAQGLEHYKELESLPYLAGLAKQTLGIAMKALLENDLSDIDELEKLEAESDRETEEMFEEITEFLRKRTDITQMSMFYVVVGRYCERAADQAFAIAERAIYAVTGKKKKLGLAYKREDAGLH